jgi:hypothetical protein
MDGRLMIPVGTHGLACLDEEDYAALALYMQDTALDIEAALLTEQTAINDYRLRTSMEFVTTVTTSTAAGVGSIMPDGRAAQGQDWTGATVLGGGATISALSSGGAIVFIPPKSGWYDVGCYANVIPAGAVTVGSERVIYLQINQVPNLPDTVSTVLYQERVTETNTGGEFLNLSALVYLIGGRSANLSVLIAHTNTGSNLVTQVGAKAWLAYYGPKGALVTGA